MKEYNLRNSEDIKKEFKENLLSFVELIDDKEGVFKFLLIILTYKKTKIKY